MSKLTLSGDLIPLGCAEPSRSSRPPSGTLTESDLTDEQQAAITALIERDETFLVGGLGFGKAVVAATAAKEMIDMEELKRVIVFAPLRVCELTWGPEFQKWSHLQGVNVGVATGAVKRRKAVFETKPDIVITNFENISWTIDNYGSMFDGMVIDEITKLKSVGGTMAKKMRFFVRDLHWRVGMTASPAAESGEDLYGQMLLIDLGESLGTRKQAFKEKYMTPTDYHQRNWEWKHGAIEEVAAAIAPSVYKVDDREYLESLPPLHDYIIEVEPPPEVLGLSRALKSEQYIEFPDSSYCCAENAAQVRQKRQQLAHGGLYGFDWEGEPSTVYDTPFKLPAVQAFVARAGSPVIIVYEYTFELAHLRMWQPGAIVLGAGEKVTPMLIDTWNRGGYPVMFMHYKSAAHGLNLQFGCRELLHMGPIDGADPWAQCIGRIRRRGQPFEHVNRTTLVATGTVEEEMVDRMIAKEDREVLFMDALEAGDH